VLARNTAMNLLNKIPMLKRQLAKTAMGYGGYSSKLARGLKINSNSTMSTSEVGSYNEK